MQMRSLIVVFGGLLFLVVSAADAADWTRFRGPNGIGVSPDEKPVPVKWSESENLKWKAPLPGPGASSPIVVGDRVFVTCWTGYADAGRDSGRLEDLKRNLICIDRKTGKQKWMKSIDASMPEDSFRGMFAENGYASHTPTSDGERVIVFYGKSGVHAYDMDGKHQWKADVGDDLDRRGWGSASSPILYKNLVFVLASIESHTLYALDKTTGKVVWKQEADGFGSTWGTPALVEVNGHTELVVAVPYEIWGLNPDTGKLLWYCEGPASQSMCSSLVVHGSVAYAIETGPGGGGAVAVRAGGKNDVTKTHVVWSTRDRSRVGTPVIHDGRMFWVGSGVANCVDIKTGDRIYRGRLGGGSARESTNDGNGGGNRRRRGFGGGRGGQDYSSPVIAGGNLYYSKRSGDTFVIKLGKEFEQVAANRFETDKGDFSASPAISDGELFIRSSRNLYCVSGD